MQLANGVTGEQRNVTVNLDCHAQFDSGVGMGGLVPLPAPGGMIPFYASKMIPIPAGNFDFGGNMIPIPAGNFDFGFNAQALPTLGPVFEPQPMGMPISMAQQTPIGLPMHEAFPGPIFGSGPSGPAPLVPGPPLYL